MFLKNFDSEIEERINAAIRGLNVKCIKKTLFGAIVSNRARHIERSNSDYDFFLICEFNKEQKEVVILKDIAEDVDFLVFDINVLKKENKRYFNSLSKFPSFEEESQELLSSQQTDYYVMPIFECLCSDFLWDSGYVRENLTDLLSMIDLRNVIDYFYSRICGNYAKIVSKRIFPAIKYLTTLNSIWMVEKLLANRQLVNLNTELLGEFFLKKESSIYGAFKELLQINSGVDMIKSSSYFRYEQITTNKKTQVYIENSNILVGYIKEMIQNLTTEILKINKETLLSVSHDTMLYEYCKEIYYDE